MLATGGGSSVFPADVGDALKDALKEAAGKQSQQGGQLRVAVESGRLTQPLGAQAIDDSRQATTALRTRLQALMQAVRIMRNHSGYAGLLDTRKLHTLAVGNAKVFLRRGERMGVNTAVHILLDASGSMNGAAMTLASQACFAVASALHGIKCVSIGVTAFPGEKVPDTPEHRGHWNTVTPLLRHHEKQHTVFAVNAHGGTLMDAALWWALQQMTPLPEPRKIVLLITDGSPDSTDLALKAIEAVESFGIEVYGIGIADASIRNLLPPKDCRVINGIHELAPSMFEILQKALLHGTVTQ